MHVKAFVLLVFALFTFGPVASKAQSIDTRADTQVDAQSAARPDPHDPSTKNAPATSSAASAPSAHTAEAFFKSGITAFQKGDFKQAQTSFRESLKLEEDNPVVLHNLAMTAQRSGQMGEAIALWRKALALHPGYAPAERAIHWARGQLERPEIPHETEFWESLRGTVLFTAPIISYIFICALLLLSAGWLILRYFGTRRRALLDEKPLPPFPASAAILTAGFLFFALTSVAKVWDLSTVRGTILPKKVEARSSPDAGATALFDLYEGLEVIVRANVKNGENDWTQVTYPGGPTGWIPRSAVFATTDKVMP